MKILNLLFLILIFFSCTSSKTFEKEIQIIKESNKNLKNSLINITKEKNGLIINIVPETPIFEHPHHSSAITSVIANNLYLNEAPQATTFKIKMEVDSIRTIVYNKSDIKTIIESYKDTVAFNILSYITNNFSPADPGILDSYINLRVLVDFPMLKEEGKATTFYSILNDYIIEYRANEKKGYAQNIFVVLWSMDKEFDLLSTESRYSKIIEKIWNLTFNTNIREAEKKLFPDTK